MTTPLGSGASAESLCTYMKMARSRTGQQERGHGSKLKEWLKRNEMHETL